MTELYYILYRDGTWKGPYRTLISAARADSRAFFSEVPEDIIGVARTC